MLLKTLLGLLIATITFNTSAQSNSTVITFAKALQYKTVSHQHASDIDYWAFSAFLNFLRKSYPTTFETLEVTPIEKYSLILEWKGSNSNLKPVLFDAHYDVTPVEQGTLQDWVHEPYAGIIDQGYIWGRGSIDDKLAVISTFEAIEKLLLSEYKPKRTLIFSFAHDEEIGGKIGATSIAAFLKRKGIELEYMIGEGGGIITENSMLEDMPMAMIALAEKTYLTIKLQTSGQGGHSSSPPQNNALAKLAAALDRLHNNPFEAKLVPPVSDMFEALGDHTDGMKGFLFSNQWLGKSLIIKELLKDYKTAAMVRSTTAVTMMHSGIKENVIPQTAEAMVNFRLLPGDEPDTILEKVREIINDDSIKITPSMSGKIPSVANINAIGYNTISSAIKSVMPEAVIVPGLLIASTDTRHYTELTKNIYRFRPYTLPMPDVAGIHGTNERIAVSSVINAVKLSEQLLIHTSSN